jgi:glycerol-3-phosphate dehydrogenase subunit C
VTTTYDPFHPQYLDEGDVRAELTRVYDLCQGCRLCANLCSSFPTLFELVDREHDQGAAKLTKAEQDQVVDECFQCKRCYLNCPYVPGQSEWNLDFPRLMLRADAMRTATGAVPARRRLTNSVMGRTDLVGKLAVRAGPLANATVERPGSVSRKVLQALTGVSAVRVLPPYAKQRFTTWFKQRPKVRIEHRQGKVAVFPTCLVEYQNPGIGHDLVKVYERNGVECEVVDKAKCCGAPWLHAGEVERFTKQARENVGLLAAAVRAGNDIVVAQPTCGYVLKRDYVDYVGGTDAKLVARQTFDAAEYLMLVHNGDGTTLDTKFPGDVPETVAYHAPCHLRAQEIGLKSRDLLKVTGAKITLIQECSGIDGTWGLRAENVELSLPHAKELGAQIEQADCEVVAGDCNLANGAIAEQTGRVPHHPLQVMARAYGIPEEDA